MGNILFGWQLGAGQGHVARLKPLAEGLLEMGHSVTVVLRDLTAAGGSFSHPRLKILQAPFKHSGNQAFPNTIAYYQLLSNAGFGGDQELQTLTAAWRNIFELVRPDLIVLDHAPVALLAARGFPAKTALVGSGFFCPPDERPLPFIVPVSSKDLDLSRFVEEEELVLERANKILLKSNQPKLDRLGNLFSAVDETFILTFRELDHFGPREGCNYWGPILGFGGDIPKWEASAKKKIFAYLKPYPGLPALLEQLSKLDADINLVGDGLDRVLIRRFESKSIRFSSTRLDLRRARQECAFAIINANHGTACALLLGGKPLLQIPLFPEQELFAKKVIDLGCGISMSPRNIKKEKIEESLQSLLTNARFTEAAKSFADQYAGFNPETQQRGLLSRLSALAGS